MLFVRHASPWRLQVARPEVLIPYGGKAMKPPKTGWHAATFAAHGQRLITTLAKTAKIVQRRAQPQIARLVGDIFRAQLDRVIAKVNARRPGARAVSVEINLPQHEALWAQAIREVFDEMDADISLKLVPPIQSVMVQGYSKTGALLGIDLGTEAAANITRQARAMATRIVRINSTTREKFRSVLKEAIDQGLTVTETAKHLRERMAGFETGRLSTIARTETMRAWTDGSIASLKQSETLTHVSVIGCESREEDRWDSPSYQQFMYHGESTCNIRDVPIADADELNFHPNHTGVVIPSRFKNEDGSDQDLGSGMPDPRESA